MRVISKDLLMSKLNNGTINYVSELKLMYWLCMYGEDIEIEEENDGGTNK